jgi:hypothetical protein
MALTWELIAIPQRISHIATKEREGAHMLAEGEKYRFTWDDGDGGQAYEYFTVVRCEGAVVLVQDDKGTEAVINMATPKFIRADPWGLRS